MPEMHGLTRARILVLASTYPRWVGDHEPGFVHELCRRLVEKFDVTVLCPSAPGTQQQELLDGVCVIRFQYAPKRWQLLTSDGGIASNLKRSPWKWLLIPFFLGAQALALKRLIQSVKPDVIHAHWLLPQGALLAATLLAKRQNFPFVVTSHGGDLFSFRQRIFGMVKRKVAERAAAVTVVSSVMRKNMVDLGVDEERIEVLPMGVDLAGRFKPLETQARNDGEIIFVGRLVEKKGLKHLLDAMPTIVDRLPQAKLKVYGYGPEESALKQQAQSLGVTHAISFEGAVSQEKLPEVYRRAAVFVSPFVTAESGDEEGLGLVLVEAIGCGCPIVVGNVPAVSDVLGDMFTALTVDPRDTSALSARIISVLENPALVAEKMIVLRQHCYKRFDWEKVAAAYTDVFERVCRRGES